MYSRTERRHAKVGGMFDGDIPTKSHDDVMNVSACFVDVAFERAHSIRQIEYSLENMKTTTNCQSCMNFPSQQVQS